MTKLKPKSKSKIIYYEGHEFKSDLELFFFLYLQELEEHGFVANIGYETSTFMLSEPYARKYLVNGKKKVLEKSESLLQKSSITSDFTFDFLPKAEGIFYIGSNPINCLAKDIPFRLSTEDPTNLECLVEVKSVQESSRTSSNTSFPYKCKFCLEKWGRLIYKVKPYSPQGRNCLFEKTFTPAKVLKHEVYKRNCAYGRKSESKIRYKVRTIDEYLKSRGL
jgi:hypothetical protein